MAARNKKGKFVKSSRVKQNEVLRRECIKYWNRSDDDTSKGDIETPVITPIASEDHVYHCVDPLARDIDVAQEEIVGPTGKNDWREGRRIIELGTLATNLNECKRCGQPLHLSDCVAETRFGLAQILQVQCRYKECRLLNDVPTGKKHLTEKGGKAWDINTKVAVGMINGGFGESHLNVFLAALNIPGISKGGLCL
ncbi:uncharacterized protein LOC133202899 [Saccostrea echinata]|uniref:uncharacterized protein LOC133202899 n=1 Tax=Saccostrea echinata TaxID=191078 RepID=UPI002A8215A8|nr:uncharacterized protein LOC133202899 [Saccostrea echinata]